MHYSVLGLNPLSLSKNKSYRLKKSEDLDNRPKFSCLKSFIREILKSQKIILFLGDIGYY